MERQREEREYQRKRQERAERLAQRRERRAERPAAQPQPETPSGERSTELDALLAIIHERSAGNVYSPENVQEWTGLKRTRAFDLLKYGEQVGDVQRIGKGRYTYSNGREVH
jgi:hypothetical protein